MSIFNVIALFGGLALFLYGMRIMGDGLKHGSSGALKKAMGKVTNSPIVGFLLGLCVTAVIQSSTATIVLTSGLVGAGIITLHQSIGIILGANVGTTVTGQIIRLLDGKCTVYGGLGFLNSLTNIERIADQCSNLGIYTIALTDPDIARTHHDYIQHLHQGDDSLFNAEYQAAHEKYFGQMAALDD